MSATNPIHVLVVDPPPHVPPDTGAFLTASGFRVETLDSYSMALAETNRAPFDAMIVPAPPATDIDALAPFQHLLRAVDARGAAAIVLADERDGWDYEISRLIDFAPAKISKEEIGGRLTAMLRYHHVVRAMECDLHNMQRLLKQLTGRFSEVDQEMRLAGRLQSAFLPRGVKTIGPARFATLYRPATFVSGDIYDIYRVDERHVAFYLADAVGHGMAASLLTMFIKNAVVSKKIYDDRYDILDPNEALQFLNRKLCEQQLPSSQFVTAAYGLLNLETRRLQLSRAGHPYPLLCSARGEVAEVQPAGGLLGLFENEEYPAETFTLKPGEKLILYSDGLELAFAEKEDRPKGSYYYNQALREIAALPAEQFVAEFARQLDDEAGSLNPQDDVTLVVLEIDAAA